MEKFTTLTSIALPFPHTNVDTDMIYPSMTTGDSVPVPLERNSDYYGRHGFANLRYDEQGNKRSDCILNEPRYQSAKILIALDNFACGSSREMAVWSLMDMGFRCIIAPSFGDIFFSNACINGLLPVRLPRERVMQWLDLASAENCSAFTVDLVALQVTAPDGSAQSFELDTYRRQCLLEGVDEIGYTLNAIPLIEKHEHDYRQRRPWLITHP